MAVYIYEPNAFEKIVAVEGEEYRRWNSLQKVVSFGTFLEKWKRECKPNLDEIVKSQKSKNTLSLPETGSLYGLDGFHRYLVCMDGEILFHSGFSNKERTSNAKKQGFNIF